MRLRSTILTLALVAAACGGDDSAGDVDDLADEATSATEPAEPAPTTTAAPTTTTAAPTTTTSAPPPTPTTEPEPVLFTEPGPWSVGIATLDLGDRLADVYYPAIPEPDAETEIFDTFTAFPEELIAFIPDELGGLFDTNAYRDAIPANDEEAYPILIYSHGFGGYRQAASFHLSHVASWGFVVITIDHLERGLKAQALNTVTDPDGQDVLDVKNALAAIAAHPDLGPVADQERIAITGHSAGGGTAGLASNEEEIDAFITIAGTPSPELVDVQKPALVIIGQNDLVVEEARGYALFEGLENAALINVEAGGHNSFSDSCARIYDMGGLGALTDLIGAAQVARAEDGCVPPYVVPQIAYDTLNHYTVQFLLARFLDPSAAGELIDTSDVIGPLADFQIVGDPFG